MRVRTEISRDDDGNLTSNWHELSGDAALTVLAATEHGLNEREVADRIAKYGPNRLPERARRGPLIRFLHQFHNVLIYVLLGSAVITIALDHLADSFVILAVVIANAIVGFIQEGKAEKAMDAIRRMLAPKASLLRSGERCSIESESLVPGDIVLLEAGDKVPADLRLLTAPGLQIQEAILTGESVPVEKRAEAGARDAVLGDRACMAFSGTLVTSGQAMGPSSSRPAEPPRSAGSAACCRTSKS